MVQSVYSNEGKKQSLEASKVNSVALKPNFVCISTFYENNNSSQGKKFGFVANDKTELQNANKHDIVYQAYEEYKQQQTDHTH